MIVTHFSLQNIINEQIKTFDESHERHFIDMYINKVREAERNGDETSTYSCKMSQMHLHIICILHFLRTIYFIFYILLIYFHISFSDDQLTLACIDFAFPALTALSTTVTFLFQQICHEPEVQRKIQEEIDNVVGQGRFPTLDDRIK